jgi:peptidyl-tRNA hydrolase
VSAQGNEFGEARAGAPDRGRAVEYKQMILLRTDLGMRRGKEIAQGAHTSLMATLENLDHPDVQAWIETPFAKVAVGVTEEKDLLVLGHSVRGTGGDLG